MISQKPPAAPTSAPNLGYKTGMSMHDALGAGQQGSILGGLMKGVNASSLGGTAGQAASQVGRQTGMLNAANLKHAMAGINADQNMDQQAKRSAASLHGLEQQAQQHQQGIEQGIQQRNLATDVYGANLGFGAGLAAMQIRAMQGSMADMRAQMQAALQGDGGAA